MKSVVSVDIIDDSNLLEKSMSEVAAAIADPSRISILCALMDGRAWTATELSSIADIAPSTASAHLAKLLNSQLITCLSQGRHRYYRLAGQDTAALLETLMGLSMKTEKSFVSKTPKSLRKARTCYDHLAGEVAVALYEYMDEEGWFLPDKNALSAIGMAKFQEIGVEIIPHTKRKSVCPCLDWSERRAHLGGGAGAALLITFEQKGWIARTPGYREVTFTDTGKKAFLRLFGLNVE